jgi:multiple sugar transport system ATP-binding protein
MAGVVLENVSRVYPGSSHRSDGDGKDRQNGQVWAVNGINLEVRDREFLVLVGPSGCGKTTTLRLIAGLEELTGGKITIGQRVVNDVPPKDRDIAMVFQNYALYPHLTVYKNLAFGLELREKLSGWDWMWRWALPAGKRAELTARRFTVAQRVQQTARTLGIDDLLERYPRQLSGGQRQRVALGRAIVRNPAVFLFDEPLSNLDAKLRVEMRRELKLLHQRLETTMIYVTHDQVEALTLGERIVVMNEGTIQQVGKPMELYDWPANRFVAGFIGTPAMNFIEGTLDVHDGRRTFFRGSWETELAGPLVGPWSEGTRPAVLGIRPEHVRVEKPAATDPSMFAVVRLVEMLGDSTVVTVEVMAAEGSSAVGRLVHPKEVCSVISKIEPRSDLQPGDRVGLQLDTTRVHLFDPNTGQSWT